MSNLSELRINFYSNFSIFKKKHATLHPRLCHIISFTIIQINIFCDIKKSYFNIIAIEMFMFHRAVILLPLTI